MNDIIKKFLMSNNDAFSLIKENAEYFTNELDKAIIKLKQDMNIDCFKNYAKLIAKTQFNLQDNKININVELISSNIAIDTFAIVGTLNLIDRFYDFDSFLNVDIQCLNDKGINKIYIKNDDLAIFESKEKIDELVSSIIDNFYSKLLQTLSTEPIIESIEINALNTNILDTYYPSDSII